MWKICKKTKHFFYSIGVFRLLANNNHQIFKHMKMFLRKIRTGCASRVLECVTSGVFFSQIHMFYLFSCYLFILTSISLLLHSSLLSLFQCCYFIHVTLWFPCLYWPSAHLWSTYTQSKHTHIHTKAPL